MRVYYDDMIFFGDLPINVFWPERYPCRLILEKTIVLHCRSWYTGNKEDGPAVSVIQPDTIGSQVTPISDHRIPETPEGEKETAGKGWLCSTSKTS